MIKFFRKIRYQLLGEGKTGKYLKYAIGEIVLVVIGILIALSINNWNEGRKLRIIEHKYLSNLKYDLDNDSISLVDMIDKRTRKVKAIKQLISIAESKKIDNLVKIDSLILEVAIWWEFIPNDNTLQELVSSGSLNIIQDENIKNQLLRLSNNYDQIVIERNHMRREYDSYIYDPLVSEISFLQTKTPSSIKNNWDWFYANKEVVNKNSDLLKIKYTNLLNNSVFVNGLAFAGGNNAFLIDRYEQMLKDITALDNIIEDHIN